MSRAHMVKYNLKNVTDILFFIFMSPFTHACPAAS
nr:MAG TPA: hypothetical protein [Caudoviricetes sp.]DAZ61018.1 MAG TPA: hypothetical protein [Caudoviricetes sp.]